MSESIEWFVEDQTFSPLYDLAPPHPLSPPVIKLSLFLSHLVGRRTEVIDWRGRRGWGRSKIIRLRESLDLYKLFKTPRQKVSVSCCINTRTQGRFTYWHMLLCRFIARNSTLILYSAEILEQSMEARNRTGTGLSYRPSRLHRLAELIPWNRFLGSLKV